MEKVKLYILESYDELMHKVTWPTWAELQESSVVTLLASLIISLLIVFMDITFKGLMEELYKIIMG